MQPVDINVIRHDRYGWSDAKPDATCRVDNDRLTCDRGVNTGAYKAWVIPESVAGKAGAALLAKALADMAGGYDGRITHRYR